MVWPRTWISHLPRSGWGICRQILANDTSAPTWLLNIDYKPIDGVMVYGKWSRGYRQGGLAISALTVHSPTAEKVDTYEIGAKTNWQGSIPGSFNIAGYITISATSSCCWGLLATSTCQATRAHAAERAVINAGNSTLSGFEADLMSRRSTGCICRGLWLSEDQAQGVLRADFPRRSTVQFGRFPVGRRYAPASNCATRSRHRPAQGFVFGLARPTLAKRSGQILDRRHVQLHQQAPQYRTMSARPIRAAAISVCCRAVR